MQNNLHDDDPRTIWQNQPTGTAKMNLILIQQKARQLHAKTRRQLLGTLTGPLVSTFLYAFCIKQFPHLRLTLHLLFAFALVWSIAGLYFLNQGKRLGAMPEDAGFSTGLEFCRREMERQRGYFRGDLLWSFGPILLAIGTFLVALVVIAGTAIFSQAMPFLTLVVVWIAAYLLIRARQQRKLQREIDELSDIEREQ